MSGSSSVSTPPVHVKSSTVVFHILVLSSGTAYPTEILTGWQMSEACYDDPHPCELTHFNFADDHDLVVILKLLDKVRDGFFQVVLILPPASSWSRARHVGPEGQPPIRSRSRPWGVIEASSAQYSKLIHDNRTAEISTWFAEQSLLREEPRTALIYIFPEDFGGHFSTGPASLWSLQELRAYTVHMTLYEARHFYVVFVDQTGKNRWAYSQIFQDCKKPFRWDFRTSRCTGLFFNTTDHCRNHAAVRRLTHPVSEFLLQLVFSRSSPSVLPSGNSVFLVYEVRWFSTPLRLETMRTHRLPQVLRLSPFPLSQSPGQKFTVAGSATNSPVSSCAITRHHQTWVHILLVRVWIRRHGQTFLLHLYRRARLHHPLY